MALQVRRKATLIPDACDVPVLFQNFLQSVEDFRTDAQTVVIGLCTGRHDHEFLNIQIIGGMGTTVQDVHHGQRQGFGVDAAQIFVEGQTQIDRGCTGAGHGDAKHGIGTQVGLGFCTVKVKKRCIDAHLLQAVFSNKGLCDLFIDMFDRFEHTFAVEAIFTIAHFKRFTTSCGGT